jgi:thymidine kinase
MSSLSSGLTPQGELHLIMGPMFSSKTTTLISKLDRHTFGQRVLAINHELDTRYSIEGLRTHDGKSFPCLRLSQLALVFEHPLYKESQVIGIDESQFFPDLVPQVKIMVEKDNKVVYVAGLSGSFRRELFGHMHELIPWADSLMLLNAVCRECRDGKTPGLFSKLVSHKINGQCDVLIGGSDQYQSVCRRHFQ